MRLSALIPPLIVLAIAASVLADRASPPAPGERAESKRQGPGVDHREQRDRAQVRPRLPRRDSVAVGEPSAGRLIRGIRLPRRGASFFTWDPIRKASPNRDWRRWGTSQTVRRTLRVARAFGRAHPAAARVAIGDISRPGGGDFGPRFGLPGHASHQNGLDVDVYYPRLDRRETVPLSASDVNRPLAQDLVDRFVAAGAELVFVGPGVGLTGPPGIVQPLANHDDHLHVRFAIPG